MDYYQLTEGVYRIQSGVGIDGEIFGGIFLNDTPGILIGSSGGMDFVKIFEKLLSDLKFSGDIRVYLPSVTYNEIITIHHLSNKYESLTIYVHKDLLDEVSNPKDMFISTRYFDSDKLDKEFNKKLPDKINQIVGYDKSSSFETENTKILIIPFAGPHKGHSFIYSRDHKLLCAGLILGRTSDPMSYYIDKSGSLFHYDAGLSFLGKARSDIIFPIYDEPEYTKSLKFKADDVKSSIEMDKERVLDLCSLKPKQINDITQKFKKNFVDPHQTSPYNKIDIIKTKVYQHLEDLVNDNLVVKQQNHYRLNK